MAGALLEKLRSVIGRTRDPSGFEVSSEPLKLRLYHYPSCGYCQRVFRVLDELALEVDRVDIDQDPEALRELVQARGRRTVPVLRIEEPDGRVHWMPESLDIIAFLRGRFAA